MTDLITEDMMVPSEPGIDIFVRNKRPTNLAKYTAERTLLFVHGSTYPAHTGFDLPLGGQSWMEYIASRGYDVYCLDVRGYGRSTRPKAMAEPPQNNPPVARTPDAVKDITAVLNFILKRRSIARLNLLGWSWGCNLMATTAIQNPDKDRSQVSRYNFVYRANEGWVYTIGSLDLASRALRNLVLERQGDGQDYATLAVMADSATWDTTSGGVNTAPRTKAPTIM